MTEPRAKPGLDRRAAADLWRNTLSRVDSVFGRLRYLSDLQNANTGQYEHHGLAARFTEAECDRALRDSHMDNFRQWLAWRLEQQSADLNLYLSELGTDLPALLRTWRRRRPYENLVPDEASAPERELFLADLGILLELLMNEHGVDDPDPNAWPLL